MDGGSKDSKTRASLSASLCAAPARHAAAAANCEAVAPADRCARAVPAVTTRERDTERGGRSGVVVLAVAAAAAAPLRSLCPSLSIRRLAPRCVLTPAPHRVAPLHPPPTPPSSFSQPTGPARQARHRHEGHRPHGLAWPGASSLPLFCPPPPPPPRPRPPLAALSRSRPGFDTYRSSRRSILLRARAGLVPARATRARDKAGSGDGRRPPAAPPAAEKPPPSLSLSTPPPFLTHPSLLLLPPYATNPCQKQSSTQQNNRSPRCASSSWTTRTA